jgi:nucleoside-diphosphate-sugar epimerase
LPACGLARYIKRVQLDRQAPILVTGSAGRIGRAVVAALTAAGWRVRGFDRCPTPGTDDFLVSDLTDFRALLKTASGVAAVIHLAATPDDDDFMTSLLPNNLIGLHNVLEAARLGGVKRVLLASTGQVVWWQQLEGPHPIRADVPYTPRHWYSVTKIAAEMAGQAYARNFGMTVIAVRLGWCPRDKQQLAELEATPRGHNTYLSPRDAGRFCVCAVETDLEPGFSIVYACSRPKVKPVFDPEPARQLLGYEPQDQWPEGAAEGLAS